jgi:glucose/mannose-6-phosphate isomerase
MRALAASFPTQLGEGFRAGVEIAPPATGRGTNVYVVGMGGSAIGADLARGVLAAETSVALATVRSAELPRAVERKSRVVLVSYSGDTWETLRAYDAAGRSDAARVVITSGGALAARAERDDVPVLLLPSGIPPRSTVGQIFGGLLGLLDPWFPESNESRVGRIVARLRRLAPQYGSPRGSPAAWARRFRGRVPTVYAESAFAGVARRWKTQIEENGKCLAQWDELPELFHNAIVGWDAVARREARRYSVALLEWVGELPSMRRSVRYFERLLADRGVPVGTVELGAEDRLEAIAAGVMFGDHVSLFLADLRRVDPLSVDAIGRLKTALGSRAGR